LHETTDTGISFHHKSNKHIVFPDIILKDREVTYASEIKFFGVCRDQNLNWDCHVENLIVKLSKHCFESKLSNHL
jgi:hypothetical protein